MTDAKARDWEWKTFFPVDEKKKKGMLDMRFHTILLTVSLL